MATDCQTSSNQLAPHWRLCLPPAWGIRQMHLDLQAPSQCHIRQRPVKSASRKDRTGRYLLAPSASSGGEKIQKLIDNQRLTIFTAGGRVGRAHRHQGQQNDDAASSAVHRAHLRVFHLCVPNQEQRQSLIIDALSICQKIFKKKNIC